MIGITQETETGKLNERGSYESITQMHCEIKINDQTFHLI